MEEEKASVEEGKAIEGESVDAETVKDDYSDSDLAKMSSKEIKTLYEKVKPEQTRTETSDDQSAETAEKEPESSPAIKDETKSVKEEPKTNAELDELKKKADKLEKVANDRDAWIKKQAAMIGELKKLVETNTGQKLSREQIQDMYATDPDTATKASLQVALDEQKKKDLLNTLDAEVVKGERKAWIESKMPDFETHIDGIIDLFVKDGFIPEAMTNDVKRDLYKLPETEVYAFARVVKANAEINALNDQIKKRDEEIASLKSSKRTISDKINKAASINGIPSSLPSSGEESDDIPDYTDEQLSKMTRKQLQDVWNKKVKK